MNSGFDTINEFYRDKIVFVTGFTGTIGKLVTEKLLRSCNVRQVVILVRDRKSKSAKDRVDAILESDLYEPLKLQDHLFKQKIKLIKGELAHEELGLCFEDKEYLYRNVHVVIHCGASVSFTETLKKAVEINVMGTWEMLKLAEKMENIKSFVYVSTAFSNCNQTEIKEEFYSVPIDTLNLIEFVRLIKDDREIKTKEIIGTWPNTYTYSKAHAENLVRNFKKFPTAVLRPSIILSTYREPVQGWIDNIVGINGMIIGWSIGLLRVGIGMQEYNAEIIPSDLVSNSIVASAWSVAKKGYLEPLYKQDDPLIFNCVSSVDNPISWKKMWEFLRIFLHLYPLQQSIYLPWEMCASNIIIFRVCQFFLETVPGSLIDFYLKYVKGRQPKLVKIYKKSHYLKEVTKYFSLNAWKFYNDNMKALHQSLSMEEQKIFNLDIGSMDWVDYFYKHSNGSRLYFFKEKPTNLVVARKRFSKMLQYFETIKLIFYVLFIVLINYVVYLFLK